MVPNLGPLNTEPQFISGAGVAPISGAGAAPMTGQPTGNAAGAMGAKGGADVAQTNAGVAPDPANWQEMLVKRLEVFPGFLAGRAVAGSATLGGVATTVRPEACGNYDPVTVFPGVVRRSTKQEERPLRVVIRAGCSIICSAPFKPPQRELTQEAHSQRPLEQPQRRLRRQKGYRAYHQRH